MQIESASIMTGSKTVMPVKARRTPATPDSTSTETISCGAIAHTVPDPTTGSIYLRNRFGTSEHQVSMIPQDDIKSFNINLIESDRI